MTDKEALSILEMQREISRLRLELDNCEKWCDKAKNAIDEIQDLLFEFKDQCADW